MSVKTGYRQNAYQQVRQNWLSTLALITRSGLGDDGIACRFSVPARFLYMLETECALYAATLASVSIYLLMNI